MSAATPGSNAPAGLPTGKVWAMAAAAGIAVANIYYNQPMLGVMGHELGVPQSITLVATATQLGYAAGLILLLPLGDAMDRRKLIATQFIVLAVALAAAALAPGLSLLLLASLAVGISATVAQQIVPLAAHLTPQARQGAVIGHVVAGILTGILLSRTLAGFVASHAGWREMFWLAVPLVLVASGTMAWLLPREARADARPSYASLLKSLLPLWLGLPALRRAAFSQALLFAGFSAFWSTLAFRLAQPQFGLGPDAAGLFGIVGMVGIFAAPLAGRYADKVGPRVIVLVGCAATAVSWLIFAAWTSVAGLVVGVIVLDFGVQSALISNQHSVYQLKPEARARLNTLFMGTMFLGGALGSAAAALAWRHGGWVGICALGIVVSLAAVALQLLGRREPLAQTAG